MPKHFTYLVTTASLLALTCAYAEDEVIEAAPAVEAPQIVTKSVSALPFSPFTGKIKAKKVRMRAQADLDGHVIKELSKNDLISIIGEKNEFWAVSPPENTKAYVFRSYILDNVVEGNRVNVRLKPDLESPVIGHLNAGERIDGVISALNNKWYEISPPSNTHFYIAKDFVENVGGPDVKTQFDKRKQAVEQLLESATLLSKSELRKSYDEIDMDRLCRNFKAIVSDYQDFPEHAHQAKEALAHLQETYLQKKIEFLEAKASPQETEELAAGKTEIAVNDSNKKAEDITERMKMWAPVEEALYLSWMRVNEERPIQEFYEEQKLGSVALSGILEAYTSPVKNRPGDFILRDKDLPVAYLYSTTHNLQSMVGKKVRVVATPRNNNNFAFPAYYVLSVE